MWPYDGLQRLSEVNIESIALWVRIYDIPECMITNGFVRALGSKIGRVLEVGEAIKDYKRVKIDFPLENSLVQSVKKKVAGYGMMEFTVKYENIPYFALGVEKLAMRRGNAQMKEYRRGVCALELHCAVLHKKGMWGGALSSRQKIPS